MSSKRVHLILPEELLREIDRTVGLRGRSRFIADTAAAELRRIRQRRALRAAAGAWKTKDHPELARGAARFVRRIRVESDRRG
jgi:metal-responsive CopG/Arc/MetJ family transcriptional regulator